ncbi:PREDICTED: butyrophilin-like protein 1 [Miniopterus natalensis]|uniref:butyrophilin-like protein 1 n=1 Tax=Miniopterus natalensis TaxID=291302 RepID=UPI0007A6AF8E|nr:PREDICTED: butyrophilin-like protein 1 [Miniopterus natalensis]
MESVFSIPASLKVIGPSQPLLVRVGEDIQFTCSLSPKANARSMEVRWVRSHRYPAVYVYMAGEHLSAEQMAEYRGRTVLVTDAIGEGRLTLQIHDARTSDDGQYRCLFEKDGVYQENSLDLKVVGLGSSPRITLEGLSGGEMRLRCSSEGWFPQPWVQWTDTEGKTVPSLSEVLTQDSHELFQVEAFLLVTNSSALNVTCSISNPLLGEEKRATFSLSEPFFPRTCPWKVALAVVLPALALLLLGVSYAGWRVHQAKEREAKKTEKESGERNQMKKDKEMALKAKADLEAELEKRKKLYAADWRKALLYPDWRKEQFQLAPVTLNHKSFPQNSSDPERKETLREETQGLSLSNKQGDCNLIALDKEGFTSEKYYWEVDVEGTEEWTLGVYEEPTDSSGSCEGPQKKFRVLEKKGCDYRALECCLQDISLEERLQIENRPQKIVIFLDHEDSDISFYNMTDGTHIFSFTQTNFSGSLYPYFQRKSMELSPSAQY